ncbi:MAG: LTA synthase family protein [Clostridiales bacterium]|nr:LTA synthase family protein [Clostridiales bacterium]
MWKNIWNPSNRKVLCCNILTAFALNLFLEYMERKSIEDVLDFMNDRTFVFLFNALILFMFLSIGFLARTKRFTYAVITGGWAIIGLVNGVILNSRKTPFTAVDISLVKSILPVISSYLTQWQIVLLVIAIIVGVVAAVCLYLYSPTTRKSFDMRTNVIMVLLMFVLFGGVTYVGVGRGQLISKFDNLIAGYKDYGVAYGFCVTALDTGIDRPLNYSKDKMQKLSNKMKEALAEKEEEEEQENSRTPNIIFIQLESFFDLTQVEALTISEDPIPFFHQLQEEVTSGWLEVPVYGAGTINTEFEVITGMSTDYFGTGEYPYRSILQRKTCDSIAYWLKELNYESTVIHNNNASFYDRYVVFSNLGFDNFITSENMQITQYNEVGWAKDAVLTKYIMNTLEETEDTDLIYTISVQGHGDYPTSEQEDAEITVTGDDYSESELNQFTYYANQIHEMDAFLEDLITRLSDYDEDVMVIAYGDHLPGMDIETSDLAEGTKYETPYFIWDNFGYNSEHKEEESENVTSYQLASKVLSEVNIHNGTINQFHQTLKGTKNEGKNLKLLQYDMLYGADFISEEELEATEICYSLNPPTITKVKEYEGTYLLIGENFTDYSRVYVNGILVNSTKKSGTVIEVNSGALKEGDEVTIHQVSKTNENITLNKSEVYEFHNSKVEPLYRSD